MIDDLKRFIQRAEQSRSGTTLVSASFLKQVLTAFRLLHAQKQPPEPHWTRRLFYQRCESRWGEGEIRPNLMKVIADVNGWRVLMPGGQMTVHFGDEEYTIKRNQ